MTSELVALPDAVGALEPFVAAGVLGPAEVHAAALMTRAGGVPGPPDTVTHGLDHQVVLGAALAVWAPLHGHVCVDLTRVLEMVSREIAVAGDRRQARDYGTKRDDDAGELGTLVALDWPDPTSWAAALAACPLVRVVDAVDPSPVLDDHPLVLFDRLLYTQRQWTDEGIVVQELRRRIGQPGSPIEPDAVTVVAGLFGTPTEGVVDRQRVAVESALARNVTVIAGGPGTGKTFTVARILATLLASDPLTRIGLAAPTGKAAARMTEAVGATAVVLGTTAASQPVTATLSGLRAVTLHRLLGPTHRRTRFAHQKTNPLPYDVVIVDEMSMVALPLMARLMEATADSARLVLVGDPDQLPSIEAGTVLGDIVGSAGGDATASAPRSAVSDAVVRLDRQYRTAADSPIFALAEAIRAHHADDVVEMLRAGATSPDGEPLLVFHEEASTLAAAGAGATDAHDLVRDVVGTSLFAMQEAALAGDSSRALEALDAQRVLCGHRRGPYGTERWNTTLETWMLGRPPRHDHAGRVLLATRNDLRNGIVNGDTGVMVRAGDELRIVFRESRRETGFSRAELDHLELAFALTVHKSQGSEYDTVVLVHPPSGSPLIGRELLYTAVTRAKRRLVVIGQVEAIVAAVNAPTMRITGLADALSAGAG